MPAIETTYFKVPCQCGNELEVQVSKAGCEFLCPACKTTTAIESLGKLRQRNSITKRFPQSIWQFNIWALIKLTLGFAFLAWVTQLIGIGAMLILLGVVLTPLLILGVVMSFVYANDYFKAAIADRFFETPTRRSEGFTFDDGKSP